MKSIFMCINLLYFLINKPKTWSFFDKMNLMELTLTASERNGKTVKKNSYYISAKRTFYLEWDLGKE